MASRKRASTRARGYGHQHQRMRRIWAPKVATGTVACARCGKLIDPAEPWHLDHADDRRTYLGPSHQACNIAAASKRPPEPPHKRVSSW